jgi:hypothetical protein
VGVDHESHLYAERGSEDDVGGLPRDSGEQEELVHRPRDFAAEALDENPACAANILGFRVEESGRADDRLEFPRFRAEDRLGRGESREKFRRDEVHPFVGALRREDRRDEELKGRLVAEGAVRVGVAPMEGAGDLVRSPL